MSVQPLSSWTPEDYLMFERTHTDRHEFADGQIIQQAGGSRNHSLIGANIVSSLHQQLRSRPCIVYGSDMRIAIPRARRYVYPDVSVACEASHFEDAHEDTLTNPTVIIEILSPSTERYDRGKKFQAYQTIESFQEYVLVTQDIVMVEHFAWRSDALWTFEALTELSETISLPSIQCILHLAEVYAKVALGE